MQNNDYQDNYEQNPMSDATQFDNAPIRKSKSDKNFLKAVLSVVLAVVIVGGLALGVISIVRAQNPINLVYDAVGVSLSGVQKNVETMTAGSVEVNLDLATLLENFYGTAPIDGDVSLKMYADQTPAFAIVGALNLAGAETLDFTAAVDAERFALLSEVILGNDAYGITFAEFMDNFDNSVFGPDGTYSLGVSADDIAELFAASVQGEEFSKDSMIVFAGFADELKKSLKKHAAIEKGVETLEFGDTECKTTTVTVALDSESLYAVCHDMMEHILSDKKLEKYLDEYEDYLAATIEYYGDDLVGDFYDEMEESLENLEDSYDEGYVQDSEIDIVITFYINKSGKNLVGFALDGEFDGEKLEMECLAGPSAEKLDAVYFLLKDEYSTAKATFEVEKDDKDEYAASFVMKMDGETVAKMDIELDRDGGEYALTFEADGEEIVLSGQFEQEKRQTVMTIDSLSDGYNTLHLGITVTVTENDEMPEIGAYTDILTMDETEIDELIADVAVFFETFVAGMLY